MCVMCRCKESWETDLNDAYLQERIEHAQCYGYYEEPFLRGSILGTLVDLFPQSEVIVDASVKVSVKGDPSDIVEHEV